MTGGVEVRCRWCGAAIARREANRIIVAVRDHVIAFKLDGHGRPVLSCPTCGRDTIIRREVDPDALAA